MNAVIAIPSMMRNGSPSINKRSLNVPVSDSSALQTTNADEKRYGAGTVAGAGHSCNGSALIASSRLSPVGNAAPPRPIKPDALSASTISTTDSVRATFSSALNPPRAMYSSMLVGSITPRFAVTSLVSMKTPVGRKQFAVGTISFACLLLSAYRLLFSILYQNCQIIVSHILVHLFAHHHYRRVIAMTKTRHNFERVLAVGCRLTHANL